MLLLLTVVRAWSADGVLEVSHSHEAEDVGVKQTDQKIALDQRPDFTSTANESVKRRPHPSKRARLGLGLVCEVRRELRELPFCDVGGDAEQQRVDHAIHEQRPTRDLSLKVPRTTSSLSGST